MPKNTPIRIIDSQKTRAASFLGGSASAGGTTDHGLLLGLADDDHIQYLRADGTRTLTGNMLVSASVTIDGVDISAHAADADAHHTKQHGITDAAHHTVTGSQYQIVGLTSTNTLGLLTAASSPTTNQVVKTDGSSAVTLVDLTVSSDLFMTGTLDFGTNTITEDATYLQFAGSKPLRFAQNIGNANWTLYTAGGYTTTGSISITGTAGDLTVGSNVLFVDNSAANVGINMAPDAQFALDINGPARATYWIGPHAIQLKNVLMLCHYDGRQPFATNYSGEPNGHMGQVATVSGGVIYRPGMFGTKAVQIADATTNLITNPSFEGSTTGWSGYSSGTVALSQIYSLYGQYSMLVGVSSSGQGAGSSKSGLSASTTYTLSAWVYLTIARSVTLHASDSVDKDMGSTVVSVAAYTWTRLALSFATDSHTTVYFQLTANGSTSMFVDGVQMEQKGFSTPYCDGSLGDGHAWSGTAHASTSTRSAATLSYPTAGNVNQYQFTLMAWVNPSSINAVGQAIYRMTGTTAGHVILELDATGKPRGYLGTASVTAGSAIPANAWTHLAMIYDSGTLRLYINGVYSNGGTSTGFVGIPATMYVGNYAAAYMFNGLIDDLCILDRTMVVAADNSCAELRSIYESNAPVFAETSTFSFRPTPKGLLWADDEGLWMKDTAGNPVFGIYGGESTKSWSAFTLSPGDLLIGHNTTSPANSAAILWSKTNGTFGFYGAGSATAQVEVSTSGYVTAGAGAVALNSSGIQITAPSSQSAIGSYKFYVTGKTITSGLSAYYNSGADTYYTGVWSNSSNIGNITTGIDATIGGGGTVKILFGLTNSLSTTSTVYTLSGGNVATWWFGSGGTNYVGINTAAAPTKALQVNGDSDITGVLDVSSSVRASTFYADSDAGGVAGTMAFPYAYDSSVSSGAGSIRMCGATNRSSSGFVKLYIGTTAVYVPYFLTITG